MDHSGENTLSELQKLYCPPVDSALFAAVASDFDLTDLAAVEELCQILSTIRESALEQEDLPFDPTGTFNHETNDAGVGDFGSSPHTSPNGQGTLHTRTDTSSHTSNLVSSENDGRSSSQSKSQGAYTVGTDGSLQFSSGSDEETIESLVQMFPTISLLDITQSLKKSGGDPTKCMDVLLNLAFFDESQIADDDTRIAVPKGIDGFMEGSGDIGYGKGSKKNRGKKQKLRQGFSHSSTSSPPLNKWETGKADIEFISSRTPDLPKEKVSSIYHANGGSLFPTIRSIALSNCPKDVHEIDEDPVMLTQVAELAGAFPNLQTTTLIGLLKVTSNMPSAATDFATVLARRPSLSDVSNIIKFTAAPIDLSEEDNVGGSGSRSRSSEVAADGPDYAQATAAANAHFAAGSAAYNQARESYRRSKSNHLFSAATAVYRESAEKNFIRGRAQLSLASDRLVDNQSTKYDLDLHGITVANAVRIARERVQYWWDNLGDAKYVRGGGKHVHGGYKIITGVGNHSHDGTSRLGPAVSRMLIQEGWRVEIDRGFLLVTGAARAR
ncbi:hypothetical protein N7476_009793 [Penicillium atrosanguineum]|uniref:Smr domain-containing protein n=1 Tax=Penicillium atrosanguineum TaxID=1132637 RepID=A0A9W9PNY8_9EURO|nr:hypothetical protein N7526_008056 [Penicillium atrosanguineum]KAJ5302994.1 hypothetical protein N7476_009793 [Penicillium atrosanguineum]